MTAPTYTARCLGNGHTPCDALDEPDSDLAARKHTDDARHVTTTCLAGGPVARAWEASC